MFCGECGAVNPDGKKFCVTCGEPLTPGVGRRVSDALDGAPTAATTLTTGTVLLNRYLVKRLLGQGGMGQVYLAHDQTLRNLPVAIKTMSVLLQQDPQAVERLKDEALAAMQLAHPHIVRVNQFEDGATLKFLVMEYVEGETLAQRLAREKHLAEDEARRIGMALCDALEHAHGKGVLHRDVKPANVLIGADGTVKLADFGIARVARDSVSRLTGEWTSGTLIYMAPETVDGERPTPAADLYGLGAVLYELASGEPPFHLGDVAGQIRSKPPAPLTGVSEELNAIVLRLLAKRPNERFADAATLRAELDGSAARARAEAADRVRAEAARLEELARAREAAAEARRAADRAEADRQRRVAEEERRLAEAARVDAERAKRDAAERRTAAEAQARQDAERQARATVEARQQTEQAARRRALEEQARADAAERAAAAAAQQAAADAARRTRVFIGVGAIVAVIAVVWIVSSLPLSGPATSTPDAPPAASEVGASQGAGALPTPLIPTPSPPASGPATRAPSPPATSPAPVAAAPVGSLTLRLDAQTTLELVRIEPGSFQMGSENGNSNEKPVHGVTIRRGFELGKYEVTQAQWRAVMGKNPSHFSKGGDACPVESVSWDDAQAFIGTLNARRDGYTYRLPTEAEWEYAARAGTTGDYAGNLDELGWYDKNAGGTTHLVGQKRPNAWGLYDMHGNVWEWVSDWFASYSAGSVTDPTGASSGAYRVFRGGSWPDTAGNCRSAIRSGYLPGFRFNFLGFRLLRVQSSA